MILARSIDHEARDLANKGLKFNCSSYLPPTTSLALFLPLLPSLSPMHPPTHLLPSVLPPPFVPSHTLPPCFPPIIHSSLPPFPLPPFITPFLYLTLSIYLPAFLPPPSLSTSLSSQPELCTSISKFMAFVHGSVNATSKIYLANERRYNYTTPKSFLELVGTTIITEGKRLSTVCYRTQVRLSNTVSAPSCCSSCM